MIRTIKLMAIALIFSGLASCDKDDDTPPDPNITFRATLSGANERPTPNNSPATGTSTLIFNNNTKMFTITTTYSGLVGGTVSGAHIHKGDINTAAGVIYNFGANGASIASPIVFTAGPISAAEESDLKLGLWYVNVHTTPTYPGGEIRGQLMQQ